MEAVEGSKNSSRVREETQKSCAVTPSKAGKKCKETYSNGSAPALDGGNQTNKPFVTTHSQQKGLAHMLKASKTYLKSFFSKASTTREANEPHFLSSLSIQRESHECEDAATAGRSFNRENSYVTRRKSFCGSFCFIKGSTLTAKPTSKPFSSNGASTNHIGVLLERKLNGASSDMENSIEAAIAHCKQSQSADPKNMIDASKDVDQKTLHAEGYAHGPVHCRSWSSSCIAAGNDPEKPCLGR